MTDGDLGKSVLVLEVDETAFSRNIEAAQGQAGGLEDKLHDLAVASEEVSKALGNVKVDDRQAAESTTSLSAILEGVHGISDEARAAAVELDKVKLTDTQAAETEAAASVEVEALRKIGREADENTAKLAAMNRESRNSGHGSIGGTSVGYLGAAIGAATLAAPVLSSATFGLLAVIPGLLTTIGAALGTVVLGFHGLLPAIEGNKKAFDALDPSAQQFVETVRSLDSWFKTLADDAQSHLLPALMAALHDALSPSTVNAITSAIGSLATAMGQAGEQWGKYFGSAEFQQIFGPLMADAARNIGVLSDTFLHLFDTVGEFSRAAIPLTNWFDDAIDKGAQLADAWTKDEAASGRLSSALNDAKQSLQEVGSLLGALFNALGALGSALYPVSQTALKDLTDGLNSLAGIIDRNKQKIQDIVGGALAALKTTIQDLYPFVADLATGANDVAKAIGGWKPIFEALIALKMGSVVSGWITNFGGLKTNIAAADTEAIALRTTLAGMAGLVIPISIVLTEALRSQATHIQSQNGPNFTLKPKYGGGSYSLGAGRAIGDDSSAYGGPTTVPGVVSNAVAPSLFPSLGGNFDPTKHTNTPVGDAFAAAAQRYQDTHKRATQSTGAAASPFGTQPPWTSSSTGGGGGSKATPSGANLLTEPLRDAIQKAKDEAAQTQGAVAEHWLKVELADLQKSKDELTTELASSSGKKKAAIEQELRDIDGQIASVNKGITDNLKQQAQAIKSSFSSTISTAKSDISSAFDVVKEALDSQFEQQTQDYISNVLGPQFFQGNDVNTGAPLQTPLEAQLAAMQAQDTASSLQDAITQAQAQLKSDQSSGSPAATIATDEQAIQQAQRAQEENELSIQATKQRQQADADYAKAVQQYQAERTNAENQLNAQLDAVSKGLQNGTKTIGDLTAVAANFGLSLSEDGGVVDDLGNLQDAVTNLSTIMQEEAAKLALVGDLKDAASAAKTAQALSGSAFGSIDPGIAAALGGSLSKVVGSATKPIPMASGGRISASVPTLILMGEAGYEEAMFSGAGRSLDDALSTPTGPSGDIVLQVDGREIARIAAENLGDPVAGQTAARNLKPWTDRGVSVPTRS